MSGCLDCRKSGFAAFSRKLRCVLRLCCPLIADNSTLTPRKVFSATHMSRQKTYNTAFASADAKLCEAFFDKLNSRSQHERLFVFVFGRAFFYTMYGTVNTFTLRYFSSFAVRRCVVWLCSSFFTGFVTTSAPIITVRLWCSSSFCASL